MTATASNSTRANFFILHQEKQQQMRQQKWRCLPNPKRLRFRQESTSWFARTLRIAG
jgi:hypothetical protein